MGAGVGAGLAVTEVEVDGAEEGEAGCGGVSGRG